MLLMLVNMFGNLPLTKRVALTFSSLISSETMSYFRVYKRSQDGI